MGYGIAQDEGERASEARCKEAPWRSLEQEVGIGEVEKEVRGHRKVREGHAGECRGSEREEHRPSRCLRRAGQARGEPAGEEQSTAREKRIARPRNAERAERCEQQRVAGPISWHDLPGGERG